MATLKKLYVICCLYRRGNAFIADSNNGATPSGGQGEIHLGIDWKSDKQLKITYPKDARVFKQIASINAVGIEYATSR